MPTARRRSGPCRIRAKKSFRSLKLFFAPAADSIPLSAVPPRRGRCLLVFFVVRHILGQNNIRLLFNQKTDHVRSGSAAVVSFNSLNLSHLFRRRCQSDTVSTHGLFSPFCYAVRYKLYPYRHKIKQISKNFLIFFLVCVIVRTNPVGGKVVEYDY